MRLKEVMERCGIGRASVYNWMNEKKFPKQVKIGPRAVAWRSDEVEKWIETRKQVSINWHQGIYTCRKAIIFTIEARWTWKQNNKCKSSCNNDWTLKPYTIVAIFLLKTRNLNLIFFLRDYQCLNTHKRKMISLMGISVILLKMRIHPELAILKLTPKCKRDNYV